VIDLLESEGISKKGISRAAFAAKARQALLAIHSLIKIQPPPFAMIH
jgi:hypothetical protein